MQTPEIPEDLIERIASGNAAVFIGAGLSQGAGLLGWPELLRRMLEHMEQRDGALDDHDDLLSAIDDGDLLDVAEELRERLGPDEFRRFMKDQIRGSDPKPTASHRLLERIPFGVQVTTNYDGLLEGAYALENDGATLHTFTHHDVPELGAASREGEYLLKLHGDISRIETVVLGTTDYRSIVQANPACKRHLSTLFSTRTVLFLGYGLADPDLLLLLDELREDFRSYTATHYTLMPEDQAPKFKRSRFEKDYGIRVLTYRPTAGHPEVVEFLRELAAQVQERQARARPETRLATPVERLAQEVTEWLTAIGYQVNRENADDHQLLCLAAVLEQGSVSQRVRVHCIGGEIRASHVEDLEKSLDRRTNQGWAICDQRVSPQAAARAAELEGVETYRLADFLSQKVWGPYIAALATLVLKPQIPDRYVDPACHKQEMDTEGRAGRTEDMGGLDAYMDGWLTERGKVHMSLLGEFGTGKTWFCRHFAWRCLQRYLEDPVGERLPLLVTLREFTKTTSPEQLINDLLLERYRLPFVGSAFEVFRQMNRRGKLLLILDGFDEMARKADYQTVVDNFWELAKLVEDESKVVLTSRTEYFRWARESEKVLAGQEYGRRTIELEPPRFEVLYLTAFNDERIRRMIVARLGEEKGGPTADKVLAHHSLKEMARKPVLTELLLAAIDEAGIEALDNEADIYLQATNRLLLRNIDTARTFTSTADKLYFLCELAWEMIRDGELQVHYKEFPERIRRWFGGRIEDDRELDHWDYDLRNQTLLHRNAAGYYEFAHKSLAEFFVAVKFAAEIEALDERVSTTYREADGTAVVLPYEPLDLAGLAKTFGFHGLGGEGMQAIRELLAALLSSDSVVTLERVLYGTRGLSPQDLAYVGTNALMLLTRLGRRWRQVDLSGIPLPNSRVFWERVEVEGQDLTEADLSNSHLVGSNLTDCLLEGTDLSATQLQKVTGLGNPIGVHSVCWSRDGDLLIAGGSDGCLRLWRDLSPDDSTLINPGCRGWIPSIVAMPDRRHILFADRGDLAVLWDLESSSEIRRFVNPHTGDHQVSVSPDGLWLLCGDDERGSLVFDIESAGERATIDFTAAAPEFAYACGIGGSAGPWITGHEAGLILLWQDLATMPIRIESGLQRVMSLCIRPDADTFYSSGSSTGEAHDRVLAWSIPDGRKMWSALPGYGGYAMVLAPLTRRLAIGSWSGESAIAILSTDTGSVIARFKVGSDTVALAFHPNETHLASGHEDGTVRIWDVEGGSPTFGQCLKILDVKLNARGARISGAQGLEEEMTWQRQGKEVKGTKLEFLADCGAVLDESQKRRLAELHEGRKNT